MSRRLTALITVVAGTAVVWGAILPKLATRDDHRADVTRWRSNGIDPSATFWTDVPRNWWTKR